MQFTYFPNYSFLSCSQADPTASGHVDIALVSMQLVDLERGRIPIVIAVGKSRCFSGMTACVYGGERVGSEVTRVSWSHAVDGREDTAPESSMGQGESWRFECSFSIITYFISVLISVYRGNETIS